jgi:hypothetical protein
MTSHLAVPLGWTLIHALWQTTLVALFYALWRHRALASSGRRYAVAYSALTLAAAVAGVTFVSLASARLPEPIQALTAPAGGSGVLVVTPRVANTVAPASPPPDRSSMRCGQPPRAFRPSAIARCRAR